MAVRKSGRRNLIVGNRLFIWWVGESEPDVWCGQELTVASEDRKFYVRFHLDQEPHARFLVVIGPEFGGLPDAGGCWIRIASPDWQTKPGIRPSDVRELIEWSLATDQPRARMDYRGDLLEGESAIDAKAAHNYARNAKPESASRSSVPDERQLREAEIRRICNQMFDLAAQLEQTSELDPAAAETRQRLFELREAYRQRTGTFPILPEH